MKRKRLVKHLENHGCIFVHEGGSHTIYKKTLNGQMSTLPRHKEVKKFPVQKICKDLGIEKP